MAKADIKTKITADYKFIDTDSFGRCTFQLPMGQELNLDQSTGWAKCFHAIAETDSSYGQDRLVELVKRLGGQAYNMAIVVHWSFHPDNPEPYVKELSSKLEKYSSLIKKTSQSPLGLPLDYHSLYYACLVSQAKDGKTKKSRQKFEQMVANWMSSGIHDAERSITEGKANWEFWPSEVYHALNVYTDVDLEMPSQFRRKRPVYCCIEPGREFELMRKPMEAKPWQIGR